MIHVIYIPVIFACLGNGQCNFAQSEHTSTPDACRAVVVEKIGQVKAMAASAGQTITQLKGACITIKGGML